MTAMWSPSFFSASHSLSAHVAVVLFAVITCPSWSVTSSRKISSVETCQLSHSLLSSKVSNSIHLFTVRQSL